MKEVNEVIQKVSGKQKLLKLTLRKIVKPGWISYLFHRHHHFTSSTPAAGLQFEVITEALEIFVALSETR